MVKLMKLSEAMGLLRQNDELQAQLNRMSIELIEAKQDRELLAAILCRQPAFGEWLLEQDVSSAHERKPSGVKGVTVEDVNDLTLALQFAGRAQ